MSRGPDAITSQLLEEHQRALTSGTDQKQCQGESTQKEEHQRALTIGTNQKLGLKIP